MTAPDTSTEAWLDAAVLEELQPPCEGVVRHRFGGEKPPAEFVARWATGCPHSITLACVGCATLYRQEPHRHCSYCGPSRYMDLTSIERL